MEKQEREEIRKWVAKLKVSAGCSCCRDDGMWELSQEKLAKLLKVPKYSDGSGYDFHKFSSL